MIRLIDSLTLLVSLILFPNVQCESRKEFDVVNVEETINALLTSEMSAENLSFELSNCLYLDVNLKSKIDQITAKEDTRDLGMEDYIISRFDEIELTTSFENQEKLFLCGDKNLVGYLDRIFGFEYKKAHILNDQVLKLENKFFVNLRADEGEYAFVFEFKTPKVLRIGIAYMVVN